LEFLPEEIEQSLTYQILPGIKEILNFSRENKNFVLGLATGNLKKGAKIKLNRADLNQYFSFGGFGCDSEDRPEVVKTAFLRGQEHSQENISRENTYVIGDTHHDITAGKALGVKTIAVTTGSYREDHLANYKPSFLFKDLSDIKKFFEIFSD
jgi:phosphoglycolate phosphatase-like HAD superfamily hydrolase